MAKLERVLVANRGEIALRIIRTLHALGIEAVAVYSDADAAARPTTEADRAFPLPGVEPRDTYLNGEALVEIARRSDCDAVHPGYGFLSENEEFARLCKERSLKFVGPSPTALAVSGNKLRCKMLAESKGIAVVPYAREAIEDAKEAARFAQEIGFPVLLKSTWGGGGRGIKEARSREEVHRLFESSRREAASAFGRSAVFIEKKLVRPRHIEVQVLASENGEDVVSLGERECSIQRRYQKLIEISPSPVMDDATRERVGQAAVALARAIRYTNAGTIEFLREESTGEFYFLEVNARLQVEHPVTEVRTGLDLVAQQIRITEDGRLPIRQKEVRLEGAAIECRINSEDPLREFLPASGRIEHLELPAGPGIRVDTALYEGCEIPPYYDSLLAKLIAGGSSFEEARHRARVALDEFRVVGVPTTIGFHRTVMSHPQFARGDLSTSFIEESRILDRLREETTGEEIHRYAIAAFLFSRRPPAAPSAHRSASPARAPTTPPAHGGRFVDGL